MNWLGAFGMALLVTFILFLIVGILVFIATVGGIAAYCVVGIIVMLVALTLVFHEVQ